MEVRYSLNGKYFKDFGVSVSKSSGIADILKRKAVNTYDWAEYHGMSVDLSAPKFEQREIELKCFIVGDNWQAMFDRFNGMIRDEFAKAGTQRLLIEPFDKKAMPYEVYMTDEVKVDKTFRNGKSVGIFTLKMIEPNPIKKVLYLAGNTLNLSYNCPSETEIFYTAGFKETAKGNVSLSGKNIPDKYVSTYAYQGRNLLLNSDFNTNLTGWNPNGTGETISWSSERGGSIFLNNGGTAGGFFQVYFSTPGYYVVSFDVKPNLQIGTAPYIVRITLSGNIVNIPIHNTSTWQRYSVGINVQLPLADSNFAIQALGNQTLFFDKIKLAKESTASAWTPAPSEQKYIIIAGNVDEITNLTTNATVLWEKL